VGQHGWRVNASTGPVRIRHLWPAPASFFRWSHWWRTGRGLLGQFPFVAEEVREEVVAPLGRAVLGQITSRPLPIRVAFPWPERNLLFPSRALAPRCRARFGLCAPRFGRILRRPWVLAECCATGNQAPHRLFVRSWPSGRKRFANNPWPPGWDQALPVRVLPDLRRSRPICTAPSGF